MTREEKLEQIIDLQYQIDNSYWGDAFVDEPEYHSNRRIRLCDERDKLKEEVGI